MSERRYAWSADGASRELRLVWLPGTAGAPCLFGRGETRRPIKVRGFYLGATPVTHALWRHVMGGPALSGADPYRPVDHVSRDHVAGPGGFLERINAGAILSAVAGDERLKFRLPSETEWGYAARGGRHWRDDFRFSGSNDPDAVAWYGLRWNAGHEFAARILGPRAAWRVVNRVRRLGPRRLRSGCHHNWDLHRTVSWRYGIEPDAADGCIGFRVVLAEA